MINYIEAAIRKYALLGVEIQITELDVMQADSSEEGMIKQGYRYKEIFDKLKELSKEPNINIGACVLWGTDDGNSWRSESKPLLLDENYIYVLVDVKDHLLSKKSSNAHEQDSVEVFIDEDHAKTKTYEKGDVQYRVNFENEHSINGETDPDSFKSAVQLTKDGYQVEMALPYRLKNFKTNQILGFEVQINNDENGNGVRDSVANWSDLTGNGWASTENYGALELIK